MSLFPPWFSKQQPPPQWTNQLWEKTTQAATVATKTASQLATVALQERPEEPFHCSNHHYQRHHHSASVDFSSFPNQDIVISTTTAAPPPTTTTTTVSSSSPPKWWSSSSQHPDQDPRSALFASVRSRKRQRPDATTEHKDDNDEDASSSSSTNHNGTSRRWKYLMDPLIPQSVWDHLTGKEFPQHLDELGPGLARMGYDLATHDENDSSDWIAWTKVPSTFSESLEDGGIHVWTGRARVQSNQPKRTNSAENENGSSSTSTSYYGANAPLIKSRSILPNISPEELVDLLLDSNRVTTYNQWSIGRLDLWTSDNARTKIVQNTNQVPMQGKPLQSTTVLHVCPVQDILSTSTTKPRTAKQGGGKSNRPNADSLSSSSSSSWLLLSRAVGPQAVDPKKVGTSDILLGVNLMEPIGHPDGKTTSTRFTAITHVYSSAVPGMLADKLGVKSAINFVHDLRKVATTTTAETPNPTPTQKTKKDQKKAVSSAAS